MQKITLLLIILSVILTFLICVLLIVYFVRRKNRLLEKAKHINYTKILSSSASDGGVIMMSNGYMGGYGSFAQTKFLVVYKSGEQEIVTVSDGSKLCQTYLKYLQK